MPGDDPDSTPPPMHPGSAAPRAPIRIARVKARAGPPAGGRVSQQLDLQPLPLLQVTLRFGPQRCMLRAHPDWRAGDLLRAARCELPHLPTLRHCTWAVAGRMLGTDWCLKEVPELEADMDIVVRVRALSARAARRTSLAVLAALRSRAPDLEERVRTALACCACAPAPDADADAADGGVLPLHHATPQVLDARIALLGLDLDAPGELSPPFQRGLAALDAVLQPWAWGRLCRFVRDELGAAGHGRSLEDAAAMKALRRGAYAARAAAARAPGDPAAAAQAPVLLTDVCTFLQEVCRTRRTTLWSLDAHLALRPVLEALYALTMRRSCGGACAATATGLLAEALRALQAIENEFYSPGSGLPVRLVEEGECQLHAQAAEVLGVLFPPLQVYSPVDGDEELQVGPEEPEEPEETEEPEEPGPASPARMAEGDQAPGRAAAPPPTAAVGHPHLQLCIDRGQLLASSFRQLSHVPPDALRAPDLTLDVWFADETGLGVGVARDWVCAVLSELACPDRGLFMRAPNNPRVLHPSPVGEVANPGGEEEPGFADWMVFAGQMLGLAARLRVPVGYHLSAAMLRMVSSRALRLSDMRELCPTIARSCQIVLGADAAELEGMALPGFVAPHPLGPLRPEDAADEVELLWGGAGAAAPPVTPHTAPLLVQLLVEHYCGRRGPAYTAARAVREGMLWAVGHSVTDTPYARQLARLHPAAFNAVIGGSLEVRVEDWARLTDVYASPDVPGVDALVRAFWGAVGMMGSNARRALLVFWTGCRALPATDGRGGDIAGDPAARMQLQLTAAPAPRMPSAHTCFRQLHLVVSSDPRAAYTAPDMHDWLTAAVACQDGVIEY